MIRSKNIIDDNQGKNEENELNYTKWAHLSCTMLHGDIHIIK